ncbi:MAG: pyridoxal phosphate-dependent aminotransferase family protein, partial [Myxococcota bacterium]
MNPLDRLVTLADRVPAGLGAVADPIGPGVARIGGRSVAMLGANDYLGLSFDPEVVAAARGVGSAGTTGSRVANGTTSAHRALESAFAVAFGRSHAVAFTTGYQANLGVISGLVGPGDAVVLDAEAHASLFDGARLSGADLFVVRHNDPADLDRRLARLDGRPTVVAVEGLYSIGGDTAPLPDFAAVCRGRAALLVDEAHAFGAYGLRGLGVAEELGVAPDVITGTFSKALGGVGGFAVSDHPGLAGLRVAARSYVFTAAGTPSSIAAAHAARASATDPVRGSALRDALWARVARRR